MFRDGDIVHAAVDARFRSTPRIARTPEMLDGQILVKRELLSDGRAKLILKDPATGACGDRAL